MKRAFLTIAAVLVVSAFACAQEEKAPASLEGYVPADALLYVHCQGFAGAAKTFQQTELYKLLKEPEMQEFGAELSRFMDELMKEEAADFPLQWADIRMLLDSELAFALLDVRGEVPSMVLVVRAKDGDKVAALAERVLKDMAHTAPDKPPLEADVEGVHFKEVGPFCVARWGGDVIVTSGRETLRRAVRVIKGLDDSIAKSDGYVAAGKKTMGGREFLSAHLDVEGLRGQMAELEGRRRARDAEEFWAVSGLRDATCARLAVAPDAPGIKVMLYVAAPKSAKGALAMLPRKPLDEKTMLAAVPEDAHDFLVGRLGAAETFDLLADIMTMAGEADGFNRELDRFNEKAGFDLRKDLLSALGDEVTVRTLGPGLLFLPEFYLSVGVKDEKAAASCLEKLAAAVAQEFGREGRVEIERLDYKGRQVVACKLKGTPLPITPSWAFAQGRVFVALTPQTVKRALDAQQSPARPMLKSLDYAALRSHVAAKPSMLAYNEFKTDFESLYGGLATHVIQVLNGVPSIPPHSLATKFPTSNTVMPHVFGSIMALSHDGEGYLMESYGPFGLNLSGGGGSTAYSGLVLGWTLPVLMRAQGSARRSACMNNTRQIGLAMIQYAGDHDDKFPESFGELLHDGYLTTPKVFICPSTRQNLRDFPIQNFKEAKVADIDKALDPVCSYVKVPGLNHDVDAEFIVLHDKEPYDAGGRNCFFNDGHVQWLPEHEFQRRMEEQNKKMEEGQ